jgi:hypothetical protein
LNVPVIELDRDAPPTSVPSRPPLRLLRPFGLILAALLALALGGAVPTEPLLFKPIGVLPFSEPDAAVLLGGDIVYTVTTAPGDRRITTAWDAATLAERWTATTPVEQSRADVVAGPAGLTLAGDGLLLTGPTYVTTMFDAGTGRIRWTRPAPVQPTGSGLGVSQETHFRPGTEYDQASGEPGNLFWSSSGQPHTEPPQRTTVYGLDLATGERLWADGERGSVRTLPVPGDTGAVVIVASGRLTLRDGRTGAVQRTAMLPHGTGFAWAETAGDLLLVRQGTADGSGSTAAYAMSTLDPVWRTAEPAADGRAGTCYGLPCRRDRGGLTVLDPRAGRPLWHAAIGQDLSAWGDAVVEVDIFGAPVRLRDRATGGLRVPLAGWDHFSTEPGLPMLLTRTEPGFGRSVLGVLTPGARRVQPLGFGPPGVSDCAISARFIVCRAAGGLRVWSYRA